MLLGLEAPYLFINMKATAVAPSNIAFIKFFGKTDDVLRLPANSSISMCLSGAYTTTTVEFSPLFEADSIEMQGSMLSDIEAQRVISHLDRLRSKADSIQRAKVITINNFPKSSGIASSASGFAALTIATAAALELSLSERELSILARQGSGSACRSIPEGFVFWEKGIDTNSSYAYSLYPSDYWNIYDIVAIVDDQVKKVSTTDGHLQFVSSSFYQARLEQIPQKIEELKHALAKKDFELLGTIVEAEALNMHAVALAANPALLYLQPGSITVIKSVWELRSQGLPVYFTIDAGPNIHILCEEAYKADVLKNIRSIPQVKQLIENRPAPGTKIIDSHLF
jgi:diphosphomevalonate decarboxylase